MDFIRYWIDQYRSPLRFLKWYAGVRGYEDGVFISQDGSDWTSDGLVGDTVYAFTTVEDGVLAGTSSGLFLRTGTGTWEAYGTGLEDRDVLSLLTTQFEGEELIVVGTDQGVYFSRPGVVTVDAAPQNVPDTHSEGITTHPNPATENVTLRFSLDESSSVEIEVFDLLGRRVHQQKSQRVPAGSHTADLNVRSLTNGTYVVRLTTNNSVQSTVITVLR